MKKKLLVSFVTVLFAGGMLATPAFAAKPDKGAKGSNKEEKMLLKEQRKQEKALEKEERKATKAEEKELKAYEKEVRKEEAKAGKGKDEEKLLGLEKQRVKKDVEDQKETLKGSEQGQTTREEHRKKWWKFWE